MAVTNYYSINSVITGEEVVGGSRLDYLTDALGSVVATVNPSAQVVNTYRYKPYGALLAKTGGGSDPAFQWVGSEGYRTTGKSYAEVYVRARHYSSALGRWTTEDFIASRLPSNFYIYSDMRPTAIADPSGLQPNPQQCLPCPQGRCRDYLRNHPDQTIINRTTIGRCVDSPNEIRAIYEEIKRAFCQTRAFCGGRQPSWCSAYIIPPRVYRDPSGPGVVFAYTPCCEDGSGNCRGMVVTGPGWNNQMSPCLKTCLLEHELTHQRDCESTFGRGPGIDPRTRVTQYPDWSECRGWCNGLKCLLMLAERFGIRPPREVPSKDIVWENPRATCGPGFERPNPITGRPVVPIPYFP